MGINTIKSGNNYQRNYLKSKTAYTIFRHKKADLYNCVAIGCVGEAQKRHPLGMPSMKSGSEFRLRSTLETVDFKSSEERRFSQP